MRFSEDPVEGRWRTGRLDDPRARQVLLVDERAAHRRSAVPPSPGPRLQGASDRFVWNRESGAERRGGLVARRVTAQSLSGGGREQLENSRE